MNSIPDDSFSDYPVAEFIAFCEYLRYDVPAEALILDAHHGVVNVGVEGVALLAVALNSVLLKELLELRVLRSMPFL